MNDLTPADRQELHELNRFLRCHAKHYGTLDGVWEAYTKMVLTGVLDECQVEYQEVEEGCSEEAGK